MQWKFIWIRSNRRIHLQLRGVSDSQRAGGYEVEAGDGHSENE